jgi:hypothetical protein
MIVFTLTGQEETNIERLQRCLVERQRTLDIAHGQNYMGQNEYSPSRYRVSTARIPISTDI